MVLESTPKLASSIHLEVKVKDNRQNTHQDTASVSSLVHLKGQKSSAITHSQESKTDMTFEFKFNQFEYIFSQQIVCHSARA